MVKCLSIVCTVLILAATNLAGQVIHRDDIELFAARFRCHQDSLEPHRMFVEAEQMLEWRLLKDSVRSPEQVFAELARNEPDSTCWLRVIRDQQGKFKGSRWSDMGGGMFAQEASSHAFQSLYVMGIVYLGMDARSVFSFWDPVRPDSLALVSVCQNTLSRSGSVPKPLWLSVFPDGSIWGCFEETSADAWDVWQRISFARETEPCLFEAFHTINWHADFSRPNQERVFLDFQHCRYPSHQVLLIREFFSAENDYLYFDDNNPHHISSIDSVWADPLNVWTTAVEYFGIDTTR